MGKSITFVGMNTNTIQSLIRHNKIQIRELETECAYLKHIIQLYYNSCNPLDPYGVLSHTSFTCLNNARDELLVVKKKIKLLAEVNYSLKYSIR